MGENTNKTRWSIPLLQLGTAEKGHLSSRAPYRVAFIRTASQFSCFLWQILIPSPFPVLVSKVLPNTCTLTSQSLVLRWPKLGHHASQSSSHSPSSLPFYSPVSPPSLSLFLPLFSLLASFFFHSLPLSWLCSFSPLLSECLLHSLLTFQTTSLCSSGSWTIMAAPKQSSASATIIVAYAFGHPPRCPLLGWCTHPAVWVLVNDCLHWYPSLQDYP